MPALQPVVLVQRCPSVLWEKGIRAALHSLLEDALLPFLQVAEMGVEETPGDCPVKAFFRGDEILKCSQGSKIRIYLKRITFVHSTALPSTLEKNTVKSPVYRKTRV